MLRARAGLSQQELADRALISVQAVSALERGYRKTPYRKTLERIADALGLQAEARTALELSARRARTARLSEDATPTHNLPRQLTSFVGRSDVVNQIAELVTTAPLASIVGPGGVGKTRAAIETALQLRANFPDGVWFVELAPLNDPTLVEHAIAGVLGVRESPKQPLLATVLEELAKKHLLLVLDNCEHVIAHARRVAGSILRECPSVALLVTTREALSIAGERVFRVPPLAVPGRGVTSPDEAMSYSAVALFADRVRASDARFAVTAENVDAVIEVCRRLDGLPLALELAAARAPVFSPAQIAQRLDRRFELRVANGDSTPSRHETMRAVIDWSYTLLSSRARLLFERLSAFTGGFTLDAAVAVCCDDELPAGDVLDLLSSLIAQSLVTTEYTRGEARYTLLETTRRYALEKLAEHGRAEALAKRHADAFLSIAERLDSEWYTAPERTWFQEAENELANFRGALEWSLDAESDVRTGGALAAALARVWYSLSPVEGRRWVRAAIDKIAANDGELIAQLRLSDAELCGALGEYKTSLEAAEDAMQGAAKLDELRLARARQAAGSALGALGRGAEAETLLEKTLATAQRLENRRLQALALGDLGTTRSRRGDTESARTYYAQALAFYDALGLERPAASIAGNLAEIEFAAGDAATALQRAEEARAGHEATNNQRSMANDLSNMAAYLVALNCFDDAQTHAARALAVARSVGATVLTAYVLQHLAAIAVLQPYRDKRRANEARRRGAMLVGFVEERLSSLGTGREFTEQQEYERMIIALDAQLGEQRRDMMAMGAQWTEDAAAAAAIDL